MSHVTLVKKIKLDGEPCRKCADIENRLLRDGYADRITRTVIADERDPESEGLLLASRHSVERAPFFIVEHASGEIEVFDIYFKLVRDVFKRNTNRAEADIDLLEQNPALAFI
jgi:hypothetical protein